MVTKKVLNRVEIFRFSRNSVIAASDSLSRLVFIKERSNLFLTVITRRKLSRLSDKIEILLDLHCKV